MSHVPPHRDTTPRANDAHAGRDAVPPLPKSHRRIDPHGDGADLAFSVATLVRRPDGYAQMCASFTQAGFGEADCEFLLIDNTGPAQTDAFSGLNAALNQARGRFVILCHDDVRLTHDTRRDLEVRLDELTAHDRNWAVAGNAGGIRPGRLALRISDPHASDQDHGPFPARAQALDENFLVVKKAARIGFSRDLEGFHLYGADLCQMAHIAGHTAYVIDFHLTHLSGGKRDASFAAAQNAFQRKWRLALSPRWMQTTCTVLRLSGSPDAALSAGVGAPIARSLARRWFAWSRPHLSDGPGHRNFDHG